MSQLTQNTADLDALIDKAQALPDELDTSDADATASDIVSPKTAYVNGEKITGTIPSRSSSDLTVSGATVTAPAGWYKSAASKSVPTATQATPTITVDANGLVTAKATQSAGYVASGTKSATLQLPVYMGESVITPTTEQQLVVNPGEYVTNGVYVDAIEDLTTALDEQETLISELEAELEGKAAGGGGSVETCTVVLTAENTEQIMHYHYVCLVDGRPEVIVRQYYNIGSFPVTLENVICGTVLCVTYNALVTSARISAGGTFVDNVGTMGVIKIDPEPNINVIVEMYDND